MANKKLKNKTLKTWRLPQTPGGLLSAQRFRRANKRIKLKNVIAYLRGLDGYTVHKPARRRFRRRRVVVLGPFDQWIGDLADMQKYAVYNDDMKYIYCSISMWLRENSAVKLRLRNQLHLFCKLQKSFFKEVNEIPKPFSLIKEVSLSIILLNHF